MKNAFLGFSVHVAVHFEQVSSNQMKLDGIDETDQ